MAPLPCTLKRWGGRCGVLGVVGPTSLFLLPGKTFLKETFSRFCLCFVGRWGLGYAATSSSVQGEVQFLTGGDREATPASPRAPIGQDLVRTQGQRYSPDGRAANDVFWLRETCRRPSSLGAFRESMKPIGRWPAGFFHALRGSPTFCRYGRKGL